ncbi:hypothetical protein [Aliiruegeria lutimaris]|uniref:Uncharacterized protein n=1 Tax=Aliiruegeria lutimaris TaxID=571298 RepID=A0A1G8IL19_9RHOB|nr:hypothetical protein [Aliiruegeria lutimaris]SDI19491.1 hypothetical protein SAMN04488026_100164 [Aliiruegeria lutimaris]
MSADQAFLERLQRIESGKTWAPDGVLMPDRAARTRRRSVNSGQKRVVFVMSVALLLGLFWVFAQMQPELFAQISSGDFSAVSELWESTLDV